MSLSIGTLNFDYSSVSQPFDQCKVNRLLELCLKNGITKIDTASYYANAEKMIGNFGGVKLFKISSKANPWKNGDFTSGKYGNASYDNIMLQFEKSLVDLKVNSIHEYYLHAWDYSTPIEETLRAFDDLYKQKKIDNFGICNLSTHQTEKLLETCNVYGYNKPNVYQGLYNVYCRTVEEIFPLLEKNNIKFQAYNPLAGGILSGKYYNKKLDFKCRFYNNDIYKNIFWNDEIISNTKDLSASSCINWLKDKCDTVIIGISNESQLMNIINFSENTKEQDTAINVFYEKIKHLPVPNYWY